MRASAPLTLAEKKDILYGLHLFEGLGESSFELLASLAQESRVSLGHYIVRQGEPGSKLFLIARGEVRVLRESKKGELETARMQTGDFFGEMCILERLPRAASVQAMTDTQLVMLSYAAFEILQERNLADHDRLLVNMARTLSARLRQLGDAFALRA
jgi:CRP-like cAMP-binding protein